MFFRQSFSTFIDHVEFDSHQLKPIEYMSDQLLDFVDYAGLQNFEVGVLFFNWLYWFVFIISQPYHLFSFSPFQSIKENCFDCEHSVKEFHPLRQSLHQWINFQKQQKILERTPSVLVGYRVRVYRSVGATQWFTAVIGSYNDHSKVRGGGTAFCLDFHFNCSLFLSLLSRTSKLLF